MYLPLCVQCQEAPKDRSPIPKIAKGSRKLNGFCNIDPKIHGTLQLYGPSPFAARQVESIFFLPQKPYMPIGTLREQLMFPSNPLEDAGLKNPRKVSSGPDWNAHPECPPRHLGLGCYGLDCADREAMSLPVLQIRWHVVAGQVLRSSRYCLAGLVPSPLPPFC